MQQPSLERAKTVLLLVGQFLSQAAAAELGGIDILVNNAAFQRSHETLADIPAEEFEETYHVNVLGIYGATGGVGR